MQVTQRLWGTGKIRLPPLAPTRLTLTPAFEPRGLHFSEILLVMVMSVAMLITSSNPIFGVPLHHSFLNHSALVLLIPVLALHWLGQLINRSLPPVTPVLWTCWPIMALAVYAMSGSAIAKWDYRIDDTYLALGVYMLLLPLFALTMPSEVRRVRPWAIGLLLVWVAFSLASLSGQAARVTPGNLHEIEYLVATGFFAMFYAVRSAGLKLIAVACMVVAAVLNAKLTGYIILAMSLLHIVVTWGWRRLSKQKRGLYGGMSVFFVVGVSAVLALLYFEFRTFLPSGNPEVRLAQYETAWREFLTSPVWGNAFLSGSGEILNATFGRFYIPTHSDLLDILKHGGTLGFLLFVVGYTKVFLVLQAAVKATVGNRILNAYFLSARFFLVTALVVFTLNPLLLKGPFAFVIWSSLGCATGLSLAVLRKPGKDIAE